MQDRWAIILDQFHPERNITKEFPNNGQYKKELRGQPITTLEGCPRGADLVLGWKCREAGHLWRASLKQRTRKEDASRRFVRCPVCRHPALTDHPLYGQQLKREWHNTKNSGLRIPTMGKKIHPQYYRFQYEIENGHFTLKPEYCLLNRKSNKPGPAASSSTSGGASTAKGDIWWTCSKCNNDFENRYKLRGIRASMLVVWGAYGVTMSTHLSAGIGTVTWSLTRALTTLLQHVGANPPQNAGLHGLLPRRHRLGGHCG